MENGCRMNFTKKSAGIVMQKRCWLWTESGQKYIKWWFVSQRRTSFCFETRLKDIASVSIISRSFLANVLVNSISRAVTCKGKKYFQKCDGKMGNSTKPRSSIAFFVVARNKNRFTIKPGHGDSAAPGKSRYIRGSLWHTPAEDNSRFSRA